MSDADTRPLISVCIPTFKRPAMLKLALQSAIEQRYEAMEILVGDDSPDDSAVPLVEAMRDATKISIRYKRNDPTLGQCANVDQLFRDARGAYLTLLHDDDVLLPEALTRLMEPILRDRRVRAVYGKQNLIDDRGAFLAEETHHHNNSRFGTDLASNAADNPIEACLLQQFPNDGFLIETALAREIGYCSPLATVAAVDTDFGIRLGRVLAPGELSSVDAFVTSYRRWPNAISVSATWHKTDHPADAVKLYRLVTALDLPASSEYARRAFLKTIVDALVKGLAQQGDRASALRLLFSSIYGWRKRLSPRAAYHLALIASPAVDRIRRY
jgi:glycosyltransferase involved in cell wall biosynthesis